MKGTVRLTLMELRSDRKALFVSAIGVAAGVAAMFFFLSLGSGVKKALLNDMTAALPLNWVEVTPTGGTLSFLSFGKGIFGGGSITKDTLERLGTIKGVAEVQPELMLSVPTQATGVFFGRRVVTDLVVTGIEPSLVSRDIEPGMKFEYSPDGPIPILVSTRLLEAYNQSFSGAMKLPKITKELLSKIEFTLVVGRSFLSGGSQAREYRCRVAGVSPMAVLVGITIPIEYVRRMNAEFTHSGDETVYRSAYVRVDNPSAIPDLEEGVRPMGLEIDAAKKTLGAVVGAVTLFLAAIAVLIMALSSLHISHAFYMSLRARRREIGVMRAVGATKADIMKVMMLEALATGLLAGAAGVVLGAASAAVFDAVLLSLARGLPFVPATLFRFTPWVIVASLICGVIFCVGGAAWPVLRAVKMDPAQSLRD